MVIKYLIKKEFLQIKRQSLLPKLFIALPLIMMIIMPWAANQEFNNLKLCIIDNDQSALSKRLIQKIDASNYYQITSLPTSYKEALSDLDAGAADFILEIQLDFEKDLVDKGMANVMVSANSVSVMKGGLGSSYLATIVTDYANELRSEHVQNVMAPILTKFNVSTYYAYNPKVDYKIFMVPILLVITLTLLSGFLPALNIVSEKEKNTIIQMNVVPVNKPMFIFSKIIPYWIIGIVILLFCILLEIICYGVPPVGNLFTILLFSTIYILAISGLGLIISNNSKNIHQAMLLMFFFILTFILLSGLFTPVTAMPQWAQKLAMFNPVKYFIEIMRMIYLKGSTLKELLPHLGILSAFAVVLVSGAVWSYRKRIC
jgi:ABC-2 type transport system permease protein